MEKGKTALEEFEEIEFFGMECVKISQRKLIKELNTRKLKNKWDIRKK